MAVVPNNPRDVQRYVWGRWKKAWERRDFYLNVVYLKKTKKNFFHSLRASTNPSNKTIQDVKNTLWLTLMSTLKWDKKCLLVYLKCFSLPLCSTGLSVWRRHVWPRWWPTSWSACQRSCFPFLSSGSPSPFYTASSSTSRPLRLMGTRWWTACACCLRSRWAGRTLVWLVCHSDQLACSVPSVHA